MEIPALPLLVVVVFLFSAFSSLLCQLQVNSQIANDNDDDGEQTILLKLKNDWRNPPLISSWNPSNAPHCNWKGVTCIDGFVTGILLSYIQITDQIPPYICDLQNLTNLDLSYNGIFGEFPTSLYNCSKLQKLDLSQNAFSGRIPSDIDRISTLRILDLRWNEFSGDIPPSIGRLPVLETLLLSHNHFNGTFPPEIGNLSNLKQLDLTNNQFIPSRIPSEFGQLKKLMYLRMPRANLIGEIPKSIYNLTNLKHLNLSDNGLSGKIPLLKNLNTLDLSINSLTGTIPKDFGKLCIIQLSKNNLTGVLPPELGLYSKLETLDVSENNLTGELPENMCAGGMLIGVIAYSNNISGKLPRSLGNCGTLTTVDLHNNRFSGEIDDDFWLLSNLSTLILSDNLFSGGLPHFELGLSLTRLEINNNRFSGGIPSKITGIPHLVVFQARNNLLSGEVPFQLNHLSSLRILDLSRNQLSGEPLPEIYLLPYLEYLDLSENQFSGEITNYIGIPGKLRFNSFNLSSNRFTGRIPVEFESIPYDTSFLNNPGLCTGRLNLNPEACYSRKISSGLLAVIIFIAGVVLLVVILFVLFMIRHCRRKKQKQDRPAIWKLTLFQMLDFTESNILSSLTEDNVIGSGASGKVYRVLVNHSNTNYVAVKKIWSRGKLDRQLEKQFQSEVQILGTIRHSSIVKLLCCISSDNSKLLVYEYMENSSLDQWLHKRKHGSLDSIRRSVLDWPRRLEIAIGAAQGLCYIHHDCSPPIIHRDVKSSNILLDSEFKARIADFGLAKMVVVNHGEPKTASVIAGSFGYIAPEYARTTKITEKIDVYSFGVVLLELATGRKANHGDEHTCLAEWAWRQYQDGNNVDDALDEDVKKPCYLNEMRMVFKLGLICTASLPSHRPSMKQTLQILQQRDLIIGTYKEEEEELAPPSDVISDDTEIELAPLNNV